ncbi:MAG: rod shape-determining protein RodA [Psychroflexus sp.]|uniref:rod shape-determining protein RodA n=1 Tax=Psychroflexus sp. S27 TaxID=1982757 RepID=UPI000C2AEB1E|nr:rod shape-determining protein RodA [Psychroflexus sp. S27]PJX21853.1 rod shape-determining protein RodA [Psychroflexus sp. S27]
MSKRTFFQLDWFSILLVVILIGFGWGNIYSTTVTDANADILDFSEIYGKQILWIIMGFFLVIVILSVEVKFYERFANVFYLVALLSLLGLLFFGKTIAGQTAWYSFGSFSIQPAEFVKATVALAMAKYLSEIDVNLKRFKNQLKAFVIILLPILLIMLQPDAGSALIYLSFAIPLYREGLPHWYLTLAILAGVLFVLTLKFGFVIVSSIVILLVTLAYLFNKSKRKKLLPYIFSVLIAVGFSLSVSFIFNKVLLPHQQDRFDVLLEDDIDIKGTAFNLYQSQVAIGSGGMTGKGWLKGTQTQGRFVPEQHTDYIFSTVGEEWGFLGTSTVVILFAVLLLRLYFLAERQKSQFNRVFGYSVFGILFFHFFVNIAMVIGLFPTVGIPLPFFSYGGSGLWGFLILIFIFLKLDAKRISLN